MHCLAGDCVAKDWLSKRAINQIAEVQWQELALFKMYR
jgi:hypothetical protein